MRKIFIFLLMAVVSGGANAACEEKVLRGSALNSNEYFFADSNMDTKSQFAAGLGQTVLECDDTDCPNGTLAVRKSGYKTMKCNVKWNGDYWEDVSDEDFYRLFPKCSDSPLSRDEYLGIRYAYKVDRGRKNTGNFYIYEPDACFYYSCKEGTELNADRTECVLLDDVKPDAGNVVGCGLDKNGTPYREGSKTADCSTVAKNANAASAARWCRDGAITECEIVCRDGDVLTDGKCVKKTEDKKTQNTKTQNKNAKVAEELVPAVGVHPCVANKDVIDKSINNVRTQCLNNNSDIAEYIAAIDAFCAAPAVAFSEWKLAELLTFDCVTQIDVRPDNRRQPAPVDTTVIKNRIASTVSAINQIELKQSVWRNAEGKFNTARLVSDSVAGVVLGTAGGLITSNVIKKNQVENGFEDISCTVGGQVVANWDDEFRVGVR